MITHAERELKRLRKVLEIIGGDNLEHGCPCDNDGQGCLCGDIARDALKGVSTRKIVAEYNIRFRERP